MTTKNEVRSTVEALKMALEALETYKGFIDDAHILEGQWHWIDGLDNVQTAIREALAEQPAQPPYGWVRMNVGPYFKSGVFNLGTECPPGWVGAAVAVYSEQPAPATELRKQQEPVAWEQRTQELLEIFNVDHLEVSGCGGVQPPASPLQSDIKPWVHATTWRGLTDDELELLNDCGDTDSYKFARAIEAKLKEKNGF